MAFVYGGLYKHKNYESDWVYVQCPMGGMLVNTENGFRMGNPNISSKEFNRVFSFNPEITGIVTENVGRLISRKYYTHKVDGGIWFMVSCDWNMLRLVNMVTGKMYDRKINPAEFSEVTIKY